MPRAWTWALWLAVAAFGAVALPRLTYVLSLAAFGVVHVLSELRYVDRRFGPRVARTIATSLVVVLAVIALGRMARRLGLLDALAGDVLELAAGLAAVLVVLPLLRGVGARILAAVVGFALVFGAALTPALAITVLAVAHNFTPVGFLADATSGRARRRAMIGASVVFGLVPLAILTGIPWRWCAALGVTAPEASLLPAGPLAEHMRAYLPASALDHPWAMHAFSACVFLQCAHYLFVIAILPRTLPSHARGYVPWPAGPRFTAVLLGTAGVAFVAFVSDFSAARGWYGVLASVHAWVEIPLLLLALGVSGSASSRPRTTSH
jgi:hypothetical protein